MPTNAGPEFKRAEAEYRKAREPQERLKCLREMLRLIPKHKGTEHVQADIKTKIKEMTEEVQTQAKKGGGGGIQVAIRPEGAAQISLIGPPNAGKTHLLNRLTGAHADVGVYPFTTKVPFPGMLKHEDIQFQLIDLPPISKDFMESWFVNSLQTADAAILVVDVSDPGCLDDVPIILSRLDEKKVVLQPSWESSESDEVDPFRLYLPTLLLANKSDLDSDSDEVKVLEELLGISFPSLTVSAETGVGLDQIGPFLFEKLGVIRVYTKPPGKPPDLTRPYTLRSGQKISDLAVQVHKELAQKLKFAKIWGSGRFEGQSVGPTHVLEDKDVVELHV